MSHAALVLLWPLMCHCDLQISNPPLFGIIAGILVGMSPLGTQLFQADSPIALHRAAQLPTELRTCLGESLHTYT